MAKLCEKHFFRVHAKWEMTKGLPDLSLLGSEEECEECIESNKRPDADYFKKHYLNDPWIEAKTDFIINMREIDRDQEWKNDLLNRILPMD